MARTHGRLATSIWADPDFTNLREGEQRAYLLAISQSSLSYAGVVPFTLRRWEGLATDSSLAKLRAAFRALQDRLYVLIDERTEEMLVRSFIKNDGILSNPNVAKASVSAYRDIHSPMVKGAFLAELQRLNHGEQESGWEKGWAAGLQNLLTEPLPEGFPNPLLNPFPKWLEYARAAPAPSPLLLLPTTCEHGSDKPSSCALCRSSLRMAAS